MAMRVETNPLEAAYAALLEHGVNQRRNLNRCQRPILNSFRGGEDGAVCSGRSRSRSR